MQKMIFKKEIIMSLRLSLNSSNGSPVCEHLQKQFESNASAVQKESVNALSRDRHSTSDCTLVQAEGSSEPDCSKPHEVDSLLRLQQPVNKVVATACYSHNQIEEDRIASKISDRHGQHSSEDANSVKTLAADNILLLPKTTRASLDHRNFELLQTLDEWVKQGEGRECKFVAKLRITNFLENIKKGDFTNKALKLDGLGLQSLPDIFGKEPLISAIETLYLNNNQFTSFPLEICKLEHLKNLSLSGNQLESLPEGIGELKHLEELYLSRNRLTSFPLEICKLEHLRNLSLSGNKLESLPEEICELKHLEELYLSGNKLESIPVRIGQLKSLFVLKLSENRLRSLPGQICELANLELLALSGNPLELIPNKICQLTKLTILYLVNTKLQSLPNEICELKNLRTLNVSNNHLTGLPEGIFKLSNLTALYFSNNRLQSFPEVILKLENLRTVEFSQNGFIPQRAHIAFQNYRLAQGFHTLEL